MTADEAKWFFALVAATSLFVAGFFATRGFWPILPFAGLELAGLAWALSYHWKTAQTKECIEIDHQHVVVRRWRAGEAPDEIATLQSAWTKPRLRRRGNQLDLTLTQGNKSHSVGRFLVDSEKRSLKARITEVLRQSSYISNPR